jgi:fumarate hydratase class II
MLETRMERDSMGEMAVPKEALFGAQTARAVENFPISGCDSRANSFGRLG